MKGSDLADVELAVAECINWFNGRRLHDDKGQIPTAGRELTTGTAPSAALP